MALCAELVGPRQPPVERGSELDLAARLLRAMRMGDDCGQRCTAARLADAARRADDEAAVAVTSRG